MAGHMGAVSVTSKNLKVIAKDEAKGLLLIEGAVPGATNGTVRVRRAKRQPKK
jgi:large subunit ribosomal protein L3